MDSPKEQNSNRELDDEHLSFIKSFKNSSVPLEKLKEIGESTNEKTKHFSESLAHIFRQMSEKIHGTIAGLPKAYVPEHEILSLMVDWAKGVASVADDLATKALLPMAKGMEYGIEDYLGMRDHISDHARAKKNDLTKQEKVYNNLLHKCNDEYSQWQKATERMQKGAKYKDTDNARYRQLQNDVCGSEKRSAELKTKLQEHYLMLMKTRAEFYEVELPSAHQQLEVIESVRLSQLKLQMHKMAKAVDQQAVALKIHGDTLCDKLSGVDTQEILQKYMALEYCAQPVTINPLAMPKFDDEYKNEQMPLFYDPKPDTVNMTSLILKRADTGVLGGLRQAIPKLHEDVDRRMAAATKQSKNEQAITSGVRDSIFKLELREQYYLEYVERLRQLIDSAGGLQQPSLSLIEFEDSRNAQGVQPTKAPASFKEDKESPKLAGKQTTMRNLREEAEPPAPPASFEESTSPPTSPESPKSRPESLAEGVATEPAESLGDIVALYDFEPDTSLCESLEMKEGDVLELLEMTDDQWWYARNSEGKEGYVPLSYVQLASEM